MRANFARMTTPRRTLIALAIAIAVAAATAAIALGGGTAGPPKRAIVTSQGLRTGTALGSYCSNGKTEAGTGVSGCADAEYPLQPKTFVPITPSSTVRVNVRKRAKSVEAHLVDLPDAGYSFVGPDITGTPVAHTHRRVWRLQLPDDLGGAEALAMFVKFRGGGDADFWAGVKPVEQWP